MCLEFDFTYMCLEFDFTYFTYNIKYLDKSKVLLFV